MINQKQIEDLYFIQNLSLDETAKELKISYSKLKKLKEQYGIKSKPKGTNQGKVWSYEDVKIFFASNNCVLLSNEYKNQNASLEYICQCGRKEHIIFSAFLRGQRCKYCGIERRAKSQRLTYEKVKQRFEEKGCTLLSNEYINANMHLTYICGYCGKVAKMTYANFCKGYRCSNCKRVRLLGKNNPNYNTSLTETERQELGRYEEQYKAFRKAVFKRDKQCVLCGSKKNKVVHHLDGYSKYPEKRTDTDNAVTLCESCHKKFHSFYGYGNNTKKQFDDFINKV